ncbi:MAG: hypothetical protein ACK559_33450, partial [bacterium]
MVSYHGRRRLVDPPRATGRAPEAGPRIHETRRLDLYTLGWRSAPRRRPLGPPPRTVIWLGPLNRSPDARAVHP